MVDRGSDARLLHVAATASSPHSVAMAERRRMRARKCWSGVIVRLQGRRGAAPQHRPRAPGSTPRAARSRVTGGAAKGPAKTRARTVPTTPGAPPRGHPGCAPRPPGSLAACPQDPRSTCAPCAHACASYGGIARWQRPDEPPRARGRPSPAAEQPRMPSRPPSVAAAHPRLVKQHAPISAPRPRRLALQEAAPHLPVLAAGHRMRNAAHDAPPSGK